MNTTSSLILQRNISNAQTQIAMSMRRLSTGLQVNSSKDNPSGLAIASSLESKIRGQNAAINNVIDATLFVQVREHTFAMVEDILNRMKELIIQYHNKMEAAEEKVAAKFEFTQLGSNISSIIGSSQYNSIPLFNVAALSIQSGANVGDTITIDAATVTTEFDITNASTVDNALTQISNHTLSSGLLQQKMQSTVESLQFSTDQYSQRRDRILNVDTAKEMANLTKHQILQSVGQSLLAQANANRMAVLLMLR